MMFSARCRAIEMWVISTKFSARCRIIEISYGRVISMMLSGRCRVIETW